MNKLIIKLKGEIETSNFNEWKKDLSAQIQSSNIELVSNDDYARAERHVKALKSAEKLLKEAKKSAINQAADIQKLFAAIDDISAEAREARLSLEHQIKRRKLEIKEELIQSGIISVRTYIAYQDDYFQLIDHSKYLDRSRFDSVVKGKAGVMGIQSAVDHLSMIVQREVSNKAVDVTNNGKMLDSLDSKYQVLFQDRKSILELTNKDFCELLDERIDLFNENNARESISIGGGPENNDTITSPESHQDPVINPEGQEDIEEKLRLILSMVATKEIAMEIGRSIKREYGGKAFISDIRLISGHSE